MSEKPITVEEMEARAKEIEAKAKELKEVILANKANNERVVECMKEVEASLKIHEGLLKERDELEKRIAGIEANIKVLEGAAVGGGE